jgi:Nif-specific regulatory protein
MATGARQRLPRDRRRAARISRFALLHYRLTDQGLLCKGEGCIYNLSTGGLLLHTLAPLPHSASELTSERVRIECQLPGLDENNTWLGGRIAWTRPGGWDPTDEKNKAFHLGVSFEGDDRAQAALTRLISFSSDSPSREELISLLEISRFMTSSIGSRHLLDFILTTIRQLFSSEESSILLIDPGTGELTFRASTDISNARLKTISLKPGQGIAGWVVKEGRPLLVNDVRQEPRFCSQVDALTGFQTRSILAAPLQDRERIIGVVEVLNTSKEKRFEPRDLDLLTAFVAHASVALRNARLISTIQDENRYFHGELNERYGPVIGESRAMQEVLQTARRAAESQATILLLGESGVGKEVLARSIHGWSARAKKPFVAINCVALSEHLLESELFGHEKGAFTGAHQQKKGLLELANGGTVFLDEIGDMKPELQAKLLRVLEDHVLLRVGGTQPIRVDLRVIAATNQDLDAAVREKRFRKDLFYRLNVVTITLPPLRNRKEDIPVLAHSFLERYCRQLKRPLMTIPPETLALLDCYDWPGNVRELENVIERAVVLAPGPDIRPRDLSLRVPESQAAVELTFRDSRPDLPFYASLEAHKRDVIRHAIKKAGGNKTKAAQLLQLQPTYLWRLCKQLGIR